MKVKMELSPDADVSVETDAAGNVISVTFTPLFASPNAQAILAYGTVTSDRDVTLDQFSLIVSGGTGKVTKKSRSKAVTAAADSDAGPIQQDSKTKDDDS